MPEPRFRIHLTPEELENWKARKKSLAGLHMVPVEDVFTPAYVQKHLGLLDFDAMLTECGFPLDLPSLADLTTEQDQIWDEMIRSRSNFGSWVDIFADAGEDWARRKIAGEPIPPPRTSSPTLTPSRLPTREDLNRLREVAGPNLVGSKQSDALEHRRVEVPWEETRSPSIDLIPAIMVEYLRLQELAWTDTRPGWFGDTHTAVMQIVTAEGVLRNLVMIRESSLSINPWRGPDVY
jgi:hypothetical protein